ncbi:hypothetical protein [Afipia clevelandensis]|uniref:Uncharacterized protein n=1 Tax=Afipia clevelandensis ATCC 49720 TaxID=883079 RepID=K8P758_9BRAD|nr:hypothetical protein [Afipia clevelandensis]EGP10176.1 hypothetical protein CSIRO_0199 [Bradyrhizobiaceae bacterium SG-6C]EKS35485.1 hypothetical protein HMPREF9696_02320 [Afipia clevelandensis ATCC 49720]
MADADLDAIIRQLAKQQHKTLTAAVKKQRDRYAALAAKAKDAQGKQLNKQLARDVLEIGTATVKRLQMSADNAAYSHARAMRQATDAAKEAAKKIAAAAKAGKPKAPKKATKKTPAKS